MPNNNDILKKSNLKNSCFVQNIINKTIMNQGRELFTPGEIDSKYNDLLTDKNIIIKFSEFENDTVWRNIVCKHNDIHEKKSVTHRVHILSIKSKIKTGNERLLCDVCCKELTHMYELIKSRAKRVNYRVLDTLYNYQKNNSEISLSCKYNHHWSLPWKTKKDVKVSIICENCKNKNKVLKISKCQKLKEDFEIDIKPNMIIIKVKFLRMLIIFKAIKHLLYSSLYSNLFNNEGKLIFEFQQKKINLVKILEQISSINIIKNVCTTDIIVAECKKISKEEFEQIFIVGGNNIKKKLTKKEKILLVNNNNHYDEIIEYVIKKYSVDQTNDDFEQNKVNEVFKNNFNDPPKFDSKISYQKSVDLVTKRNNFECAYNDQRDYRGDIINGLTDPSNYLLAKNQYDRKYCEFRDVEKPYIQPLYYNGRENKGEKNINHLLNDFNYKFNNFIEEIIFHPAIKTPIKKSHVKWDPPKLLFDDKNFKAICDYSSDYELAGNDESKKLQIIEKIKGVLSLIRKMYLAIENYYEENNNIVILKQQDSKKRTKLLSIYSKFDNFIGPENWEADILLNDVMHVVSHINEDSDEINPIMILTNLFILRNVNSNVVCQTTIKNNKKMFINNQGILCIYKNENTLDMLTTMAAHKKFFIDNGALQLFMKIVYSFLNFPAKNNGGIFDIRFKLFDKFNIMKEVITEELFGSSQLKSTISSFWNKIIEEKIENINIVSERFDIVEFAADCLGYNLKDSLENKDILEISRFLLIMQTMDSNGYGTVTLACKHYIERSFIKTMLYSFPNKKEDEIINHV